MCELVVTSYGVVEIFQAQDFSYKQSLPDPNGELSKKIPSSGISSANACLGKLLGGDIDT